MRKVSKKILHLSMMFTLTTGASGCASLLGSPMQNVRIDSQPANAQYTITDHRGDEIASGTTPDSVVLRTSTGLFQRSKYYVTVNSADSGSHTEKLNARISGLYLINIISSLPGILGLLIIDPFTGAMFTLPDESSVVLDDSLTEPESNQADAQESTSTQELTQP